MAKEKKSYIFKTTKRTGNQTFNGRRKGKDPVRYRFPENGLMKGDDKMLEDMQPFIDRGQIVVFEGAIIEKHLDNDEKTPEDILKLMVIEAQELKIKEFNGKPIGECTAEEIETAIESVKA